METLKFKSERDFRMEGLIVGKIVTMELDIIK